MRPFLRFGTSTDAAAFKVINCSAERSTARTAKSGTVSVIRRPAVLGRMSRQPTLHDHWRQLLQPDRSERRNQIEIDGASIPALRVRTPPVGVRVEPVVEVLPDRRPFSL